MPVTRRAFLAQTTCAAAVASAGTLLAGENAPRVGESFQSKHRTLRDPDTGRRVIQLTSGDCFDMPMYYFDPTFAADRKTIVFYRYHPRSGEIQLYRTHIETGETARLTNAATPNSLWRPYLQPPGFGVRDLMSAVSPERNEAIYFNRNEIRAVRLDTFADRLVARVPEGKAPSGLTGVSPGGRYFCYPYFDEKWHAAQLPPATQPPNRWEPRDSRIVIADLETGETRDVVRVNFWITHTNFIDEHHLVFCHNATDFAMCVLDLRKPFQYEVVRTPNADGWTNHYSISSQGSLMYEIMPPDRVRSVGVGFYELANRSRREFRLGLTKAHGGIHIGRDPENRRCFFESNNEHGRILTYFPRLEAGRTNPGLPLVGAGYTTFSNNQRSHFHPSLTPDRNFILFTGGDATNQTNHLFLADVRDLADTVIEA